MRARFAVLAGCLLLLTGCFDMEFAVKLEEDLSGTVAMDVGVNMESIVLMMATMERVFSGQEGPPTAAELEAARQEMMAELDQEEQFDFERDRAQMAEGLPDGVELLDVSQTREGLKYGVNAMFSFRHVNLLDEIILDEQQDPEAPPGENPLDRPFEGFTFVDEGSTYLLTTSPLNPYEDQAESGQLPPGQEDLLLQMFQGLRFAFSVEAPFEVVEHNAHRVDGRRLIWEYDLARLQAQEEEATGIMVRFRK